MRRVVPLRYILHAMRARGRPKIWSLTAQKPPKIAASLADKFHELFGVLVKKEKRVISRHQQSRIGWIYNLR